MLDTFNVQKEISDTDHVVAQLDHQREQRRRLHKKRIRPNDNLTLAERILKQRQLLGSGSEVWVVIGYTSKEPVCPRVELILKIIIILLIIFLGFIKSKPC